LKVHEITEGVHERGKLKIKVICLREACGDEVWTWMGEILMAVSHRASGQCCTAHCIFQLQFQPSDHCKPLCDLMFASLWQILAVGTSSFAPKLSEKMERPWLCKRARQSLVSTHTETHIHTIAKSAQATGLCLLSEGDDRFITTMLIQLKYCFHQPRPARGQSTSL